MDEMFLTTVSRLPTNDERRAVKALLTDGDPRDEVFRDLFWALLNSKDVCVQPLGVVHHKGHKEHKGRQKEILRTPVWLRFPSLEF